MDSSLWDAIAKVERRHWWFVGRRAIVLSFLKKRLAPGVRVLDVGAGTGFVLEALSEHFDAIGLEPDAGVRARAEPAIAARLFPGSTDNLSALTGQQFDAVMLLDVLEHVDDDVAALGAVRSLLAPGGILLVTVPANPDLWSEHDVLNEHRRRYVPATLRSALEQAGYEVRHLTHINSRLYPLAALHRRRAADVTTALRMPPAPLNWLMGRIFGGEAEGAERGYGSGLSLLATARVGG